MRKAEVGAKGGAALSRRENEAFCSVYSFFLWHGFGFN